MRFSEEKNEKEEKIAGGAVYGIFALLLPFSLLCTAVLFASAIFEETSERFPVFPVLVSGFCAGATASFYYDLFRDMKINQNWSHIRGAVITGALVYLTVSLCAFEFPLKERFFIGFANLISCIAALYMWSMILVFKTFFEGRRRFERYTESLSGEDFQKAVAEDASLINSFAVNRVKRLYIIQISVLFLSACVVFGLKKEFPPLLAVFSLFVFSISICVIGLFSLIKQEYILAGEGLAVNSAMRLKKLSALGALSATALFLALFAALPKNTFSLTMLMDFLAWLFGLFKKPPPPLPEQIAAPPYEYFDPPALVPPAGLPKTENAPAWEGWRFVRFAFIAAIAFFFLRFLIKPLFDKAVSHSRFITRVKKTFSVWKNGLKIALKNFFTLLKRDYTSIKIQKKGFSSVENVLDELFVVYTSKDKQELRENITLFAQIIVWADEIYDIKWKNSLAPGEFCAIVSSNSAHPAVKSAVLRCGKLFEQAIYSKKSINAAETEEFKEIVNLITKTKKPEENQSEAPDLSEER